VIKGVARQGIGTQPDEIEGTHRYFYCQNFLASDWSANS
jgi:hypothetical protein